MMLASIWFPVLAATIYGQIFDSVDALTCHVCESVLGNNVGCESAPNSPKVCMATGDNYCVARVAFVRDQLSSVVRACSETCEQNHYSCLQEHGECTFCCEADNCNSKPATNRQILLATDGPFPPTVPLSTPQPTAPEVRSEDRDSAMTHHTSNWGVVVLFIVCTAGVYMNLLS
ncbi:ly-6/neurotoxin-like protein 1 [Ptychodera flava]|uniref:ly-6/neurotoxin-like protein 1 n=1 Tax=Ptychodera flava TaxID=63121 RepID=UPI00396A988E